LGSAYYERIQEERTHNLEKAIAYYRAALEVRTREAFPQDWAMTQINLGTTYRDRIDGERAENIEAAIACYQLPCKF
jgi:tetratricopeptide (TPR) repeat protein